MMDLDLDSWIAMCGAGNTKTSAKRHATRTDRVRLFRDYLLQQQGQSLWRRNWAPPPLTIKIF
uniref:Uncharacterized protein n=1 Tax=Arundo donax TaxID=35708 RepID=A0A0A9CK76_ARUDO